MEIELRLRDKELIATSYDLYSNNNKDTFIIAIKLQHENEMLDIKNEIESPNTKVELKVTSVFFETENKIYYFNLEDNFKKFPINKDFKVCFGFVDENNNLIKNKYKSFLVKIDGRDYN